jgi:DNA repair exonuclease SbcCD nuclease subunit
MTNFIITGDWHYRLQNPKARLDDYLEALDTKISEVYDLAKKYKARSIIVPGDLFDSASISIPGIWRLAKKLKSAPCTVVTIPGNHDIASHNLETIPRTPYGLLRELGYISCMHNTWDRFLLDKQEDVNIVVSGHGYNTETDNDITQYGLRSDTPKGLNIHITHGMLLEKSPGIDMKHTLISDLANLPEEAKPHVLINGHYHFGLPLTWIGKTLVINPGALGRLTAHAEETEREVKAALLTINGPEDYNAKFIPLKSAAPGHVVLSREHIEEAKARDERLETFLRLLAADGEQKYLELEEIMTGIAKSENIPEDVVKEGLLRLGKAREIIAGRAS